MKKEIRKILIRLFGLSTNSSVELSWSLAHAFGLGVIIYILLYSVIARAGGQDLCEPQIVYKERVVYIKEYVDYPIEIYRDTTRKNRASLLVLNGPSNNASLTITPTSTTINHGPENAIGAMYQRDIGGLTLGVFGTSKQDVGISFGVNW